MKRLDSFWTPYALGVMAYSAYATFTESGPVAWLNIAQQAMFGSYGWKVSLLVMLLVLLLAGATIFAGLERLRGRSGQAAPTAQATATAMAAMAKRAKPTKPAKPYSQARTTFHVFSGFMVLNWVIGLSVCAWLSAEQERDNTAVYRPVDLTSGEIPVLEKGERLSLSAEALTGRTLMHRMGADSADGGRIDYHLVPLVPPGWRSGQPVGLVVRGDSPSAWPAFKVSRGSQPGTTALSLLVRVGGEVDIQPRHEFAKLGVPLADGNHVLTIVPSRDGVVLRGDKDYLQITLWSCGAMSVLLIVLGIAGVVAGRRHDRA